VGANKVMPSNNKATLVRSKALNLLLVVLTMAAIAVVVAYISAWHRAVFLYPRWAAFTFLSIAALRVISVAAIWRWSRVGVLAYLLLAAASFSVCTSVGIFKSGIPSVAGALVLVALIWPSWKHMHWWLG
jgi:hypothetical protein